MRRFICLLALFTLASTASAEYFMHEEDLLMPQVYSRYVRDRVFVVCRNCTGPRVGDLDPFTRGNASCSYSRQDECVNTTHVKEYYCNGSSIQHAFTMCTGDYACSGGVCTMLPDLTITRIDQFPSDVNLLESVSLRIAVENLGFADAPATNLTVYWTCEPITARVPPLQAGNSTVIELLNVLIFQQAGKFDVTAWADSDFRVDEFREDNNNLTKTFEVKLPGGFESDDVSSFGDEPDDPVSCVETDLMKIGRAKGAGGAYYRDEHGELVRDIALGPWDAMPHKNRIPYADFEFLQDSWTGDYNFTDKSVDHDGNITGWFWYFESDGSNATTQNVTVHPMPSGESMVWLTVTDDTGMTAKVGRSVNEDSSHAEYPLANFRAEFSSGTSFNFYDASTPAPGVNITSYSWDFGNGDTSSEDDAYYGYQRTGVFDVTHTVTDEAGHSSTVVRSTQVDSVWLPGQGATNSCGTTCLAYILRYFTGNDSHTHFTVDDEIRASNYHQSFRSEGGMFSEPVSIVEYARTQGLNAEVYQNGDFNEIRRFIDRGIPVMMDISLDGNGDIFAGHWVTVVGYCSRPTGVPGEAELVYAVYNPWGYQFEIPEEHLRRYWGWMKLGDSEILLWNNLYVAVSDQSLPPGNLDDIKTELALAESISMMSNGADDFADGEVVEGLVEMFGGAVTTVVSGLSDLLLGWGGHTDAVPLIGGIFGAADELVGGIVLGANDFIDDLASALQDLTTGWYNPLVVLEALGRMIASTFELLWDIIVAAFEFIVDILEAIVEFLALVFEAIGDFFCWLFSLDCTTRTCVLERMVSIDECGETYQFMNKMVRVGALGYVSTANASGTQPLQLSAATNFTTGAKKYALNTPSDPLGSDYVQFTTLGNTWASCASDCASLDDEMTSRNITAGTGLGHVSTIWKPNSTLLWMFQHAETQEYYFSTDSCAKTRTFVSASMNGYTRGKIDGYIRLTPAPGALKVYRYYDQDSKRFFLSTNANESDPGYVINGFLGYAYASNIPGTVPLYSYSPRKYEKGNITVSCDVEETEYDVPIGYVHEEERPCTTAVYKYCKRYIKEE